MPLAGGAFLALWNDIRREREPEYDRWHSVEHVPERVAVSGFIGARRYVDRSREYHRYFTLYAVESLAVFEHPEYLDLINNPTPWSAAMRPDFANFLRATCRKTLSIGDGIGAALALCCWRSEDAPVAANALAESMRGQAGVVAVHAGEGSGGASPIPWTKAPAATAPTRPFDRLVAIEALDRAAADSTLAAARASLGLRLPNDFGNGVYDLAFVFPGDDASARARHRRPGWQRWNEEKP